MPDGQGPIVAQVVKAVFVIGAVGNVRPVPRLAFIHVHVMLNDAYVQPQKTVNGTHPFGVTPGQVIVYRYHVHAVPRQAVQVAGQDGHQGFSLTCHHLRDTAPMQHNAAEHLHVERAQANDPLGGFPCHGKGLRQQRIEIGTLGQFRF
ncbi:MAG: hypothetical protein BWX80_01929 [Candidatus Hydrogenedentes bacterium ADurb.Bin101]|nr:MAG: hypothetical protein BWX80_01929 [Candidatus Hydrogenedentes bacterium ADurb.Bin101]